MSAARTVPSSCVGGSCVAFPDTSMVSVRGHGSACSRASVCACITCAHSHHSPHPSELMLSEGGGHGLMRLDDILIASPPRWSGLGSRRRHHKTLERRLFAARAWGIGEPQLTGRAAGWTSVDGYNCPGGRHGYSAHAPSPCGPSSPLSPERTTGSLHPPCTSPSIRCGSVIPMCDPVVATHTLAQASPVA